jgi:hypothetical protein
MCPARISDHLSGRDGVTPRLESPAGRTTLVTSTAAGDRREGNLQVASSICRVAIVVS